MEGLLVRVLNIRSGEDMLPGKLIPAMYFHICRVSFWEAKQVISYQKCLLAVVLICRLTIKMLTLIFLINSEEKNGIYSTVLFFI
jgi:hypothetical protein